MNRLHLTLYRLMIRIRIPLQTNLLPMFVTRPRRQKNLPNG